MAAHEDESGDATSRFHVPGRLPGMREPFEVLVRRHGATVLRVCRAVLGPHDAQDACSETFLAALRAYPGLDQGANIEAWLVTIAHRKAIDVLRSRERTVPVDSVPDGPAPERADGRDLDVWRALGELSDKQRAVVAYHYLAGLGYREVAQIVGGSEAAARRAGADGVAALRRMLGVDVGTKGVVA